jgi:hypothetical protein
MTENVNIQINGVDKFSPVVKKVTMSLKDMGEKVSMVGMRMSGAFTLPVVGMAAIIGKSKEVQTALAPVTAAFAKIGEDLGRAFLPVIKAALPALDCQCRQ